MAWFSKTAGPLDLPPAPPMGDKKPPFGGKAPGAKPPFGGPSEKKDVLDGKGIVKALKDLAQKEKGEGKEVKLLEEAQAKVEKFLEAESKEKKDEKEPKEEKKEDKEASY